MAKGRKLTTSRSERFLESFGYNHSQEAGGAAAPELGEDEVWSIIDDSAVESGGDWSSRASVESNGGFSGYRSSRRPPARRHRPVGGLSLAFEDPNNTSSPTIVHQFRGQDGAGESPRGRRHVATSAPVNVPDWSKIYRVDSVESMHDSDDGLNDSSESELVPPHVYLARSRKMVADSVFEGVGRTLKGRDMSRVRDAVWSQTGFDG
ncbi:uncharacterized protein LOC127253335 [Andrographis paniculata]|uniref:uncharacterized protein LOC127253335 n=1 Tax=Andrographis paniculata TaxID=175694 RepID=UPI0021E95AC5|nr:uncharacterized protein LOC127253335 [Andrographis paniculata]